MPDAPPPSPFSASPEPSAWPETIIVHDRVIACDGGGEPFGHPLIYLKIEDRDIKCSYCSRHYVLAPGAGQGGGH